MNLKQKMVKLGDWFYFEVLQRELRGMDSVLDLGCGSDSPLGKIKHNCYSVGVDKFKPSIAKSKQAKIHNEYRQADVLKAGAFFNKKSFDAVIALDLIEHLTKSEGNIFLKKIENIARKKIIILTPNDFYKQEEYENNPYQVHRSKWEVQEFRCRGYKVYGMRGLKYLRKEYTTIKYKPWFLWGAISVLSETVVYSWPTQAYQLLAVKRF